MRKVQIVIEDKDVSVFNNLVDTPLWIKAQDCCFPFKDWNDCAYPVLLMWAENMIRYIDRDNGTFDLYFMDGPYALNVARDQDCLVLRGFHTGTKKEMICCQCSCYDFILELLRAFGVLKSILERLSLEQEKQAVTAYIEKLRQLKKQYEEKPET